MMAGPMDKTGLPTQTPPIRLTYDGVEESASIKPTFREFGSEVSIAGLKYVSLSSANTIRRFVWLVLVLFGVGFASYQIADRVAYFIERPTTVDMKINSNETMTFPTVTICNQNRFNKELVNRTYPGLLGAMELIYPPVKMADDIPDYETAFAMAPEVLSASIDWEPIYASWQTSLEESIALVEFDGVLYTTVSDLFDYVVTDAGYCMQFNSDGLRNTSHSGRSRGLRLLLVVNQAYYMYSESISAGFQVVLHPHYETPAVSNMGFFVSPGHQTLVKTTVKGVTELPYPHTNCLDEFGHDQYGCELNCTARYFYEKCGCRQYFWPGEQKVCSPINTSCIVLHEEDFLDSDYTQTQCDCPSSCRHVYYDYSVSSGVMSNRVKTYLSNIYSLPTTLLEDDYVQLDIYLSDLRYEEMTVSESYSILALLCDIGGAMGLILGSTVLTIFEIGDFFIVSASQLCAINRKTKRTFPSDRRITRKYPNIQHA